MDELETTPEQEINPDFIKIFEQMMPHVRKNIEPVQSCEDFMPKKWSKKKQPLANRDLNSSSNWIKEKICGGRSNQKENKMQNPISDKKDSGRPSLKPNIYLRLQK